MKRLVGISEGIEMEYKIIDACSFSHLASEVNEALRTGWRPQGGVAAYTVMEGSSSQPSFEIWYMQAITRTSREEEKGNV
jgi:hypothetical protein